MAILLAPVPASADNASTVTVVGASGPADSGLIQHVVQPQFKAAFPQYTLNYTGSAASTAVQSAENGTGGPSVVFLDSPALESAFVAGGYSYENQFGSAVYSGDFVVAGPTADTNHANVAANAGHNVAQAFADIATAGVSGHATFISRGGTTTASVVTIREHAIWALVYSAGLTPANVVLCNVSVGDGGGMSPIDPSVQATSGQACPDSGTVASPHNPSWYLINTGASQGANVVAVNSCTLAGSVPNGCYTLTDRGTFDYLLSGTDPAGTIPNLTILSRENAASAPGGANELTDYFHAYAINPAKPGETVNLQGAKDFLGFLTSPALQSQLGIYLNTAGDPGGPPFRADASPALSATPSTGSVAAGQTVTVSGRVTNFEPGYPALAGKVVTVDRVDGATPTVVGSGMTDAAGNYSVTFAPPATGSYQVTTGQLAQIEDTSVTPAFGDLLAPAAAPTFPITVATPAAQPHGLGAVSFKAVKAKKGLVTVSGALGSPPTVSGATVRLLALQTGRLRGRRHAKKHARASSVATAAAKPATFAQAAAVSVATGSAKFTIKHKFKRGFRYALQLEYAAPGQTPTSSKFDYVEVR